MPLGPPLAPVAVNVFARAPVPGRVKTRLIPALGARGAADLSRQMTRMTLRCVVEADVGPVTLWCAPEPDAFLRALAGEFRVALRCQRGADLGERMHHALGDALAAHPGALVVGTDCPFLSGQDLHRARNRLFEHHDRVVLGPAHDGGYFLLAARAIDASLFANMPWGGDEVLERTRLRLAALGWRWSELDPRHDIDRPGDLVRVAHLLAPSAKAALRIEAFPDLPSDSGPGRRKGT